MKDKIIAVVPAAGIGKRFGEGTNKPFEHLLDKPLIIWSLEILEGMPEIAEIIPVVKESDIKDSAELFYRYGITKVKQIARGGKERHDSVFQCLNRIKEKKSIVIIHDGARPLIEANIIRNALRQLKDCDGVVVGVPVKDTIKEAREGIIERTLEREILWSIQTPQVFFYQPLYNAYEKGMRDFFYSTDDSALVERNGGKIKVIMGSYRNIKVTTPEDLMIADVFLKVRENKS